MRPGSVLLVLMLAIQTLAFPQKALVIVDIQDFYFPGGVQPLHEPEAAAQNAARAVAFFREQGWPVVHVRHDFEPGGNIHQLVAPVEGEAVITKKEVNAFVGTSLLETLRSINPEEVVFAGMQTHMCLEAAVRAAKDYGFSCTVLADACTTRNLKFDGKEVPAEHVHLSTLATLNRTYAKVLNTWAWLEAAQKK